MNQDLANSSQYIEQQLVGFKPKIAIILGSGLGKLADVIESPISIPYADIPGFPQATVEGHGGRLVAGKLGNQDVICMQGRFHYYEGHSFEKIAVPIRSFKQIGCEQLILTNAAGSFHTRMPPGSLMLIDDHINFSGTNPLIGPNDDEIGPRFVDLSQTYDVGIRAQLVHTAEEHNIMLHRGIYFWASGPTFETPAEIGAYRVMGADAVGMSTVPEAIIARHCDLKVAGISSITNLAAGMNDELLSHEETLEQGAMAAEKLQHLLVAYLESLN